MKFRKLAGVCRRPIRSLALAGFAASISLAGFIPSVASVHAQQEPFFSEDGYSLDAPAAASYHPFLAWQESGVAGVHDEAAPVAPAYQEGFAYGMQAHLYYQDVPGTLGLVQDAGFGWVKQQVRWSAVEIEPGRYDWAPLDQLAEHAAARGVKVLFSVVTSPSWSRWDGTTDGP
ncbi:MAG TPA: hypothetical protein VGW38_25470, partial [Chloroflexota bacterium]|nr:hypothetical protein [Chloroflexota bacterium]